MNLCNQFIKFVLLIITSNVMGIEFMNLMFTPHYLKVPKKYDVIIVGAGISGLSAAQHLIANGVTNILILEAKNRTGGRIFTRHFKTGPLEIGAQWIHGASIVNSVFNLANSNNLIGNESCLSHDGPFILNDGTLVPKHLMKLVYEDIESIAEPSDTISYEEYLKFEIMKIVSKYSDEEKPIVQQILTTYKVLRMFYEGDEMNLISAKDNYIRIPCDIDLNVGNDKIIEILEQDIDDSKIMLRHEVMNIDWNSKRVEVTVKRNHQLYKVSSDFVISTVSLGFLKKNQQIFFTPKLPQRKLEAINTLHFGRGVKIFLYYKKPFWKRNSINYLTLGINEESYRNTHNNWLNRIVEFYELPDNPNVLLTVAYGNIAKSVELMDNSVIAAGITGKLRNYTGDQTIPEPTEIIKSYWINDKFTLGTYSSLSPAADLNAFDELGEPVPSKTVPRVLFAGEATVSRYYGTMHGARIAGIREANRILNLISHIHKHHLDENNIETYHFGHMNFMI